MANYRYKSCSLCPWQQAPIPPDGPQPCRVLFIGEGPAKWEVRRRRPFVGDTGHEFNGQYLRLAGLERHQIRVTNSCLCPMSEDFRNPTPQEAAACSDFWLPAELEATVPEIVVPMGAVACSLFPGLDLELMHGIPHLGGYGDWTGILFPMYHPAAGLRESRFMIMMQQDFAALGRLLKDPADPANYLPHDPYLNPDYRLLTKRWELESVLAASPDAWEMAIDTESDTEDPDNPVPFCLTFSIVPGTGYMILASDGELLRLLAAHVERRRRLLILLHNSLYDLPVLARMGLVVRRFTDTMMMAYHRQDLPQSLKVLAYRLLGIRMQEYDDVVLPHSRPRAQAYLSQAVARLATRHQYLHALKSGPRKGEEELRWNADTPAPVKRLVTKAEKAVTRLEGGDETLNPWRLWEASWRSEDREAIQGVMGRRLPYPSIVHVPMPEAIVYACRDADATLRLRPVLKRLSAGFSREIYG